MLDIPVGPMDPVGPIFPDGPVGPVGPIPVPPPPPGAHKTVVPLYVITSPAVAFVVFILDS